MTKPVTLFGRKMRKIRVNGQDAPPDFVLGAARVELWKYPEPRWGARVFVDGKLVFSLPRVHETPHAAARALERKIVAAHRRLAKLIGTSQAAVVFVDRGSRKGKP